MDAVEAVTAWDGAGEGLAEHPGRSDDWVESVRTVIEERTKERQGRNLHRLSQEEEHSLQRPDRGTVLCSPGCNAEDPVGHCMVACCC